LARWMCVILSQLPNNRSRELETIRPGLESATNDAYVMTPYFT